MLKSRWQKNNKSMSSAGFTLIEVLVALVIIAIACFAVLQVVASSLKASNRIEHHMIGTWVSQDALVLLRTQQTTFDLATKTTSGIIPMVHKNWSWHAKINEQSGFIGHYDAPVTIRIMEPAPSKQQLWQLKGYLPMEAVPNG